jgi:DNA-binding transcriptional ArsR family regulator
MPIMAPFAALRVTPLGKPRRQTSLLPNRGQGHILNHMVQYSTRLDTAFAALADGTRRGILERLGRGGASISDLAESFDMTLTGIKKHVSVLEGARLVTTEKVGRVRTCRLGPRRLEDEQAWIAKYQRMLEQRYDHLERLLRRTQRQERTNS